MQLSELLDNMLKLEASDLHIKVGNNPLVRVHGEIKALDFPRLTPAVTKEIIYSILTPELQKEYEEDWEVDLAYDYEDKARFRVNAFHQRGTMAAVFRVIPVRIRTMKELNLPAVIQEFCDRPRGLVLVTGPTGSGKSTTLAAMIDHINNTRDEHIITIEDPVEFVHQNKKSLVNQRQVGDDTQSFFAALKSALRQDPDVVLIGEMRDLETISTALTTAETGHLVLATLHTTGAAQTIDRIIDVFPPEQQSQIRMQLAMNIQGIVSQTLLRRVDGRGRVAAFDIMVPTPAMRNLIRDGKTYQIPATMQTSKSVGMCTLEQALADLLKRHLITKEMAFYKAMDQEALAELLGGPGVMGMKKPTIPSGM